MAQMILGVDFGTFSVKIAQVERGMGEFKLVQAFEIPLVAEEVLSHEQAATAALAKFLEDNPIPYDSCVVSLPGTAVSFRSIELPFTNPKKIDQTIEFELESVVPFEIEELLYDYALTARLENESRVLVTYLPEANFQKFLEQVQHSGVEPRSVGVDTLDLSYLTYTGTLPPQGRYGVLDLGHSKTNLLVLERETVKMARSFSWGGHSLDQAIAQSQQISLQEARELKHRSAWELEPSHSASQAISDTLQELGQQLRQSLFAFNESGEAPVEALYLCGGTAKLNGIDNYFSRLLNINVSFLDVLDESYTLLPDRENFLLTLPSAFSAALHGVFPSKGTPINFRRGEYAYKKDIEILGGTLKKVGWAAASVVGLGILYFLITYFSLSSQVDSLDKQVAELVQTSVKGAPKKSKLSTKEALSMLNGRIAAVEEKMGKVTGEESPSALKVLQLVSSSMPPRDQLVVDIDDINISPNRVRLEGRTGSYEAVDKIKSAMEKVKVFKNVQTGNVRKGVREEIKFSLSFDVTSEEEGASG